MTHGSIVPRTAAIAMALMTAAGCEASEPPTPDAPLATVREFVTAITRHRCEAAMACCDRFPFGIDVPDANGCVEILLRATEPTIEEWEQAVADGDVRYDAVRATSRIASLSAARCDENPIIADHYSDVLIGQVPSGGSCAGGASCEEGTWCWREQNAETCRAAVGLGEDCGSLPCDLDVAYCDTQVQLGILTHRCVARLADGAACSTAEQYRCASGFCNAETSRCAPRGLCDGV